MTLKASFTIKIFL
jgi:hypothetical protein